MNPIILVCSVKLCPKNVALRTVCVCAEQICLFLLKDNNKPKSQKAKWGLPKDLGPYQGLAKRKHFSIRINNKWDISNRMRKDIQFTSLS